MKNLVTKTIEYVLIVLTAALVIDALAQVIFRYLLATPLEWSEEVARYLMIYITFLSSALLVALKGHMAVDIFLHKMSPVVRKYVQLLITLLMWGASFVLLVFGGNFTYISRTGFTTTTHIPVSWIYVALPIMGLVSIFYLTFQLIDQIKNWNKREVSINQ